MNKYKLRQLIYVCGAVLAALSALSAFTAIILITQDNYRWAALSIGTAIVCAIGMEVADKAHRTESLWRDE